MHGNPRDRGVGLSIRFNFLILVGISSGIFPVRCFINVGLDTSLVQLIIVVGSQRSEEWKDIPQILCGYQTMEYNDCRSTH